MDALLCLLILQASDGNHIDAVITSLKNTKFGKMWENFSGKCGFCVREIMGILFGKM